MLSNKLFMVDCTGLSIEDEIKRVKKMIDERGLDK